MFHRLENPNRAAISPAACGGLRRDQRPITISATSTGAPNTRQAITNTTMKANPPPAPARYGKRQILPRPTAAPTALRENARSDDQRWPLTSIARCRLLATSQPQSSRRRRRRRQSWSDGNDACREPGAPLLLRPHDNDDRPGLRNLVQVRQHFDLVVIEPENVTLQGIIVLGGGEAGVRIRGLVP